MKMRLIALAILIVVLTAGGVSGQVDCPEITEAALESVIAQSIAANDNPTVPTVVVSNFSPVCLAYSQERDRYRYVSVVVDYTCTGNSDCPSGTAVEQFDSECVGGVWSHLVAGSPDNIRTENPTATLSTTTREDCALCFSPGTASGLGITTDAVTHCVACDSSCDEGLMRCYGQQDTQCCQYYNDTTCVDTCPSSRVPDDDFNCVCPSGYTGYDCSESCPQYCAVCDADPSDCDVCENGYVFQGDECKCSINLCSVCNTSASTCDVCEGGYKLSDNTCICPVDDCVDCASDVTKCDQCSVGYTYDAATSECRRDCNVTNCAKCDADPNTCEECASDYKLDENECKCSINLCSLCNANASTCEECEGGYKLSDNTCICPVDNCVDCTSDVTKCDQCSSGYTYDATTSQCRRDCNVDNCEVCNTDVNKCDECSKDFQVDDNSSRCIMGDDGGGLSIGAIIGIVIAAIVAAIILAAIIISAIIVARKIHSEKFSIKNAELEAQPHLNPMMDIPTEHNVAYNNVIRHPGIPTEHNVAYNNVIQDPGARVREGSAIYETVD